MEKLERNILEKAKEINGLTKIWEGTFYLKNEIRIPERLYRENTLALTNACNV